MTTDPFVTPREQEKNNVIDIDEFFDSLLSKTGPDDINAEVSAGSRLDDPSVPPAMRRRLEAHRVVGVPELSTESKPDDETVVDRTTPVFDYHTEDTSRIGDKGDTSEKGGIDEGAGASNQLVNPTTQEEKPEVKQDEGGKLVDMATINPSGVEESETDSTKPPTSFETASDATDVLDRAQYGENDQKTHFWDKLHKPSVSDQPTPIEERAEELRQAPSTNQDAQIEISNVSKSDPESAHQAPVVGGEPPLEPLLPRTQEQDSGTNGQPVSQTAEQKPAESNIIGKIDKEGIVEQSSEAQSTPDKPDARITVDQVSDSDTARRPDSQAVEQNTARKPDSGKVGQDTAGGQEKKGYWARLFGGGKHGAHDINKMKEPTAADVAGVIKTDKPEKLDEAV